jgi:hypothetical protein
VQAAIWVPTGKGANTLAKLVAVEPTNKPEKDTNAVQVLNSIADRIKAVEEENRRLKQRLEEGFPCLRDLIDFAKVK